MGRKKHGEHPAETVPSSKQGPISQNDAGLIEGLIRSAVLGMALGTVLFVVADQTSLIDRAFLWLGLPAVGEALDPKGLVIVGILFGVTLDLVDRLLGRPHRFLVELFT